VGFWSSWLSGFCGLQIQREQVSLAGTGIGVGLGRAIGGGEGAARVV
jgi:hypothetical protein